MKIYSRARPTEVDKLRIPRIGTQMAPSLLARRDAMKLILHNLKEEMGHPRRFHQRMVMPQYYLNAQVNKLQCMVAVELKTRAGARA